MSEPEGKRLFQVTADDLFGISCHMIRYLPSIYPGPVKGCAEEYRYKK